MMQSDITEQEIRGGYRLDSLAWNGWGTFHDSWKMKLDGETTLLTGHNGSGKSTILDAILTLLIPTKGRNYNQAAGGKKTDRSVESYLLGVHGTTRVGTRSKAQDLRDKKSYHVIIAVFRNELINKTVSLAHVYYWSNGSLQPVIPVISEQLLTIKKHFQFDDHRHIKRTLQRIPNTTVFSTFKAYEEEFRRLFHMGQKAQDLINQIVAIKEIPKLDEFVREHMLELLDVRPMIERLREKFQSLDEIHRKIESAKQQERILRPLVKNNEEYQKAQSELRTASERLDYSSMFFADVRIQLLKNVMSELEQKKETQFEIIERQRNELDGLEREASRIQQSLAQISIQREIEQIEAEINLLNKDIEYRQKRASSYKFLTQSLDLPEPADETIFLQNRQMIETEKSKIDQQSDNLQQQINKLGVERSKKQDSLGELGADIQSLQGRTTQIDRKSIEIRNGIINELKIDTKYLPYVGELLQVREDDQEWEATLQYLLRDFALKMLVHDKHFKDVSHYVDTHDLSGRLDYDHIKEKINVPDLDPRSIFHKLEVKSDNPFGKNVVEGLLAKQYGRYIACETLEEFHQQQGKAITKNRHIKRNHTSYTKDDRPHVINPSQYRLGWDNRQKLARLQEQYAEMRQEIRELDTQINTLSSQQKHLQTSFTNIERLLEYDDFSVLDWRSIESKRDKARKRQEELKQSNDAYRKLEQELDSKQDEIATRKKALSELQNKYSRLGFELDQLGKRFDNDNQRYSTDLRESKKPILDEIATDIPDELNLENERDIQEEYEKHLRKWRNDCTEEGNRVSNLIIRRMTEFNNQFSQIAHDLVAEVNAIKEYLERYHHIIEQDLPKHEERFKELLQRHVGDEISSFKSNLERQYDDYKDRIDGLNKSLHEIEYDKHEHTYIELSVFSTKHNAIQEFKRELEHCIPDPGADAEGIDERQYQLIKKLIDRFFDSNYQRWRDQVTDVRNWLDIEALERAKDTDEVIRVHESSSGRSGGQKAKLAYTILASAIAYQYGLHDKWHRDDRFCFVMVDEVFSKSDEQNSHYAMELFETLNLQILVVTPSDKMHIVLPYIGTCCIVSNPEQNNSQLATIRIHDDNEFKKHLENGTLEDYATHYTNKN